MKNLLNPRWLFLSTTLPQLILAFIFIGVYQIINSQLHHSNISQWWIVGTSLGVICLASTTYTLIQLSRKKQIQVWFAILMMVSCIGLLWYYLENSYLMIPGHIPAWMLPGDLLSYVGTFMMPAIAHAMFILVVRLTPEVNKANSLKSFLVALAIPLSWYLFFQLILPLWQNISFRNFERVAIILFISSTVAFLFFLIRSTYILANKKSTTLSRYELLWKIPVVLVFPLVGLLLNNGLIGDLSTSNEGFFGNFHHPLFYALALINGIMLLVPQFKTKSYQLLLFSLRCITFMFTLYFFLVFLPFTPLSIFAILAFGGGFLMLTPNILLVVHARALQADWIYLKAFYKPITLKWIAACSLLVLPLGIISKYVQERFTLHAALAYVYESGFDNPAQPISYEGSLANTISHLLAHKENERIVFVSHNKIPFLSPLYNWIVLDNLTLSNNKIKTLETIYYGPQVPATDEDVSFRRAPDDIIMDSIRTESVYDLNGKYWKSQIHMELTSKSRGLGEFSTTFELPTGAWISNYYLYVDDEKKEGLLTEKKAATWVYNQITSTNRDPGILYYTGGNKVAFKVFPFFQDQKRKTGIEIIHKEPIQFTFNNNNLLLGNGNDSLETGPITDKNQLVTYIPAAYKKQLSTIIRKPYFHFLIDASKGREGLSGEYISAIENFLKETGQEQQAKFSLVNYKTSHLPLHTKTTDIKTALAKHQYTGGFFLERAIKEVLFRNYKSKKDSRPIIVVVSDSLDNSIFTSGLADFQLTYPESELFYELTTKGELYKHSFTKPITRIDSLPLQANSIELTSPVLAYPTTEAPEAYLPTNEEASLVLNSNVSDTFQPDQLSSDWESGLALQGLWLAHALHPENTQKDWLNSIKGSFHSKIMTPTTSYIVVENKAQEAALLKKQEQILSSSKSLDANEDVRQMSEPPLWLLLLLLMIIFRKALMERLRKIMSNRAIN